MVGSFGTGLRDERIHARTDRAERSDNRAGEHAHCLRLFPRRPVALDVVDRRLAETPRASEYIGEGHLLSCRQPAGLVIALGRDDVDADHRIGTRQLFGRLEAASVDLQRWTEQIRREM